MTEGVEDPKRIHELNDWIHERVADKGVAEDILKRFRLLEERMGPYREAVTPSSLFSGYFGLLAPPSDPELQEIGDPTLGVPSLTSGTVALWGRAQFEKGVVDIGFLFYGEGGSSLDVQGRLRPDRERARIFKDIKFYVRPAQR